MTLEAKASAAVAATSGAAAWIAVAKDLALELFGVPLPALLAALCGASGARYFLPPAGFWSAAGGTAIWTAGGCFGAQVALWLAAQWIAAPMPQGVLAGMALLVASLGPVVWPVVVKEAPEAARRLLRRFSGGKPDA